MPAPNILPQIDWKAVFDDAKDYDAWIAASKREENLEKIETLRSEFSFPGDSESRLREVGRPVHVLAIAEDWCPDVIRHLPVLQCMGEASDNVRVRYLFRRDHLDIFARYLTAGGEAIPKFIFLSEDFVECGEWGPMPAACREFIARGRACGDIGTARKHVAELYKADPDRQVVVDELLHLIDVASCTSL